MSGVATVYAIFADAEEASRIGRAMITGGHAACVNILAPCRSIYRWEGQIEETTETPALFKVSSENADALAHKIAELHSYEVPAIVVWPVLTTLPAYAEWVTTAMHDETG